MRRVTEQELDALGSIKAGLGLTFFGASLGAFIAFWIVLKTVPGLPADDLATFRALSFVTGAMTIFFLAWSILEGRGTRQLIQRIRGRNDDRASE